ncbi:MAG: hypothetical protein P8Z79_08500 [Sedimentisphaerales bacterium]|jgi:membrane-bound metal-dependent hydrolase YbcI (DUF457 family)
MPFTPFHMGPGIAVKALLRGSFSLMVFGWAQIVIDIQPLIVMILGGAHLHGFTHTYVGATLLAIFAGFTGKYLGEIGLFILGLDHHRPVKIAWWVAFLSAFAGTYSHVAIDSIVHKDMHPLYPFTESNALLGILSASAVYQLCIYSGLVGAILYYSTSWYQRKRNKASQGSLARGNH